MKESLDVLKSELETSARAHMNVANEIKVQLKTPTEEFLLAQSGARKNFQGIIDHQLKMKSGSLEAVNKARERYISKCQEVNMLMYQKPGLAPKEMDKSYERIRVSLEACDWKTDLAAMLETRATGKSPPQLVQYVNFYTGTSLRPLDSLPFQRTDSAKYNVHSISEYRPTVTETQVSTADNLTKEDSDYDGNKRSSIAKWATDALTGLFGVKPSEPNPDPFINNANLAATQTFQGANSEIEPNIDFESATGSQEGDEEVYEYDPYDVSPNTPIICKGEQ
ncbi:UNVERIFIED_CONTAM: hypothetical protein HDU68_012843 [Siphonaria sp. JEL0065]|nr:hypothetical protein HDU68_012843 [Siphonaria sp. JEL0065]